MAYKYYLLNRPPDIGTHPSEPVELVRWIPTQLIPAGNIDLYIRYAHGYVAYEQPLSLQQICDFELEPDPETILTTWLAYRYWLDASRNVSDAEWLIRDMWQNPPDELGQPSLDPILDNALLQYKQDGGTLTELLEVLHGGSR
ncbi:MAG: hypothetical protein DPW09_45665 [Anaerolineae bacterium]|nr:hypothetical protein [Anaerolineae bacterium]